MRLFIGSFFDPALSGALAGVAGDVGTCGGAVRWVKPGLFHLTYMFLGEAAGPGPAVSAMDAALDGVGPFRISAEGLGAFPSMRSPKVLWVGISEGAERLKDIAARLEAKLPAAREGAFVPHVTLARVKGPLARADLARAEARVAGLHSVSELSSVDLVESALSPAGPVYRTVHTKRLI